MSNESGSITIGSNYYEQKFSHKNNQTEKVLSIMTKVILELHELLCIFREGMSVRRTKNQFA